MDFKLRGRTWAGNIYHRFETVCQEVDDFVTKESVKYVENQVQTVGDSVKKIYSNVVHDFLPLVVDNKPNEGQLVTKKQSDALGTYIRSMVGIPGNLGHANERKYFKEQVSASEVGQQGQHSFPPTSASCQQADTESAGKNAMMLHEENVTQEEIPVSRFSNSQDEKASLNSGKQHSFSSFSESVGSSEDENVSGSIETSNEADQRNIFLANCSPQKIVEKVDLTPHQSDVTVSNIDDHSEEIKYGLSFKHDGVHAIYKNAKMSPEGNAEKDHPVSGGASSFTEKESSKLTSCTKEQHENNVEEDFKSNIQVKLSPLISGYDKGFGVGKMTETAFDYAEPSKEAGSSISSEQRDNAAKLGASPEKDVEMDVPLIAECKIFSKDEGHLKLSLQSDLEDENFTETPLIENPKLVSWDKFPSATSAHNQELKDFQDEESFYVDADPPEETKRDLSLEINGNSICIYTDLTGEDSHMLTEYAVEESSSSCDNSLSDLSLPSTKLHLQAEALTSLKDDSLLKYSPPSSDKDHKNTVLTKFSQAMSLHGEEVRASQTEETICSSNELSGSGLVASNISTENKIAEAEVSSLNSSISMASLNLPEVSHANYSERAENSCYHYTESSSSVSNFSSLSSGCFIDFAVDNQVLNPTPAFLSRNVSAISGGYDSAVDIADPEMETIDLSDKAHLDESCIIVDNRLHYAASSRPRKFRSYKKLLQDVFTSRKRLIKEYEQLAIWYSDTEIETCLCPKQCLLPPDTSANASSRISQTTDLCEPEWELL